MIRLIAFVLLIAVSCGCIAVTDDAVGIWENKTLPLQEKMTIKSDGTYIVSDLSGNEKYQGTWKNIGGHYLFNPEKTGETVYAGIVRGGRGQIFLIFENITYLKI